LRDHDGDNDVEVVEPNIEAKKRAKKIKSLLSAAEAQRDKQKLK
jgi:hypothetical protein